MKIKNYQIFYLLLALAPMQCFDFIPNWTILLFCSAILLRGFITFHQIIILPLMWVASFYILKEFNFRLQPESAVSILNFMILAKLLQKTKKFQTYYSLGFLWIGTFALFNTDIYYLLYLILCLLTFFNIMPQEPTAYFKFNQIHFNKKTLLTVLKALPLILLLFFIFPRFYGFFPSVNNQSLGQIGYATKINNSTFSGLSTNGKTAFYVEMNKTLPPNQLYWRGRVLTQTDGYNWNSTNGTLSKNKIKFNSNNYELISYNMKYEQSFDGDIILLDTPYLIKDINLRYYREGQFQSFKTYQKKKKATLSAQSYVNSPINQSSIERKKYLQLPKFIPKSIQSIHARIKASDPNDFILNFKKYLKKEGYLYTLNPGVMRVMNDFIKNKKGYCTHFASLLGILLRMNNIPTRLVSGFQGGIYNELGQYYLINSNDAHAWVEFYHKNQWHRVDPTEFVSPFRITQGGDAFLTQRPIELDQNYISKNFNYLKKYINNINYKLALFMDNFDRNSQEEIAKKFKLSIRTFYILGALLFSAFLIFSFKYRNRKKIYNSKIDYYFYKFSNKCLKNGITIQEHQTPANIIEVLKASNLPHEYIDFIQEYSLRRYGIDKETSKLKQIISQI